MDRVNNKRTEKHFVHKMMMIVSLILGIGWNQVFAQDSMGNQKYILTPKPSASPRINGAKVFGVRPGHPLIFTIPATGDLPITFSAEGLPDGLKLDRTNGRISGSVSVPGTYQVII